MFEALWRAIKAVNKKVWITAAFLAVIFGVGTTWIVVANAKAAFKPVSWDGLTEQDLQTVSGNGGPAVMVGNWLYFVGNYVDTSTIRYRQNEHNKVTYGAIYRAWVDSASNATGGLLYEDVDYNNLIKPGYVPHKLDKSKFQIVVPKVAGFDQAALWVFGKQLIYTSPNNAKDKVGDLQTSKIDFFRVDLDGRNHRRLYTTESDTVTVDDFTVASYAGHVFVLVKDGEKLKRVSVNDNPGKTVVVSERAKSVVFPVVTSYHREYKANGQPEEINNFDVLASYAGIMCYVYYTEELEEEETEIGLLGNRVYQYYVRDDKKESSYMPGNTVDVLGLSNGRLVYSVSTAADNSYGIGGAALGLYATSDVSMASFNPATVDNYKLFKDVSYAPEIFESSGKVYLPKVATPSLFRFVTFADSKMYLYEKKGSGPIMDMPIIVEGVSSIITIDGGSVHYIGTSGEIKRVDLNTGVADNLGAFSPEVSIRPWMISRGNNVWYFHIKTLTEVEPDDTVEDENAVEENTFAALLDLSGGQAKEYLLGRVDCKYIASCECEEE